MSRGRALIARREFKVADAVFVGDTLFMRSTAPRARTSGQRVSVGGDGGLTADGLRAGAAVGRAGAAESF
jgi:hypothetical protein